jgi:hypothetical protein
MVLFSKSTAPRLRVLHSRGVRFPLQLFDVEHRVTELDSLPCYSKPRAGVWFR